MNTKKLKFPSISMFDIVLIIIIAFILFTSGCATNTTGEPRGAFTWIKDNTIGLIFTKSIAMKTETETEMETVERVSTDPVTGTKTIEVFEQPRLDANGNAITRTVTTPLLDPNGKPIYTWANGSGQELIQKGAENSGVPGAGALIGTASTIALWFLNRKEKKRVTDANAKLVTAKGLNHAIIGGIQTFIESDKGRLLIEDGKNLLTKQIGMAARHVGLDQFLTNTVTAVTTPGVNEVPDSSVINV